MSAEINKTGDSDLFKATNNLLERYRKIEELKEGFDKVYEVEKEEQDKLIVTDLFVEKDIQILSRRADRLRNAGNSYYHIAVALFVIGTTISFYTMFNQLSGVKTQEWSQLFQLTIKPFTSYGLLVLTAIVLWKQSKAKLDQAERILEKRRANRVLQLYIYLRKGDVNIDDIERILKWGTVDSNAFTAIAAEGKAPIGALMSENSKLLSSILEKTTGSGGKK